MSDEEKAVYLKLCGWKIEDKNSSDGYVYRKFKIYSYIDNEISCDNLAYAWNFQLYKDGNYDEVPKNYLNYFRNIYD